MPQGLDPFFRRAFRIGVIHGAAPYTAGDLRKPHDIVIQIVGEYRRHGHRKPRAVGAVVEGRKLMLDVMAAPVLVAAHTACYGNGEGGVMNGFVPLQEEDIAAIYRLML